MRFAHALSEPSLQMKQHPDHAHPDDAQTMSKHRSPLYTFLALAMFIMILGCGAPAPNFSIVYNSLALKAVTQDSVKVTFDVLCEEYAGRNESPVCQEEGEVCYEVYWMSPDDQAKDDGVPIKPPIMVSQRCQRFSQTPQTITYELPFDTPMPTTPAKVVIRELPNDGSIPNSDYIFIVPDPDQP